MKTRTLRAEERPVRAGKRRADRYREALRILPPSGGGGCHAALLGVANVGRWAGIGREQIAADLAAHVHGTRRITAREIRDAVEKAFNSPLTTPPAHASRCVVDGRKLLDAILERGYKFTEATLREASPVRIDWPAERDAIKVLQHLYAPEEKLFIGAKFDGGCEYVRTTSEWITRFERGVAVPEHVIPNVLSGELGQTKKGEPSYRADSCVSVYRFAVVEFDKLPLEDQIRFWGWCETARRRANSLRRQVVARMDQDRRDRRGRLDAPRRARVVRHANRCGCRSVLQK